MFDTLFNSNTMIAFGGAFALMTLTFLYATWSRKKIVAAATKKKKSDLLSDKEDEEDRILDTLPNRDTTDYFAIFCETLDDRLVHRITGWFDDLITNRSEITHLYMFVHVTSGGDSSDCARICSLMGNYLKTSARNKITVIVPEVATSSGAQIAVSGTELVMGKFAHLSPFDDQLGSLGVKNVKRITKKFIHAKKHQFTLKEYDTILRAKYMRKITKAEIHETLLHLNYDKQTIKHVDKLFLNHKLYHSFPINIDMVRKTGLKVVELADEIFIDAFHELHDLWFKDE
jgi:hypothetical protein